MGVDFKIRNFRYPLAIYKLKRTFERTQWLPEHELEAYQLERLAAILDQAYRHVPYYRRVFDDAGLRPADIQTLGDLKKLPFLSKDTVRREGSNLTADNAARYRPIACSTAGTTGQPLRFYQDTHSNILEFVYYWRHWSWAGYKLGNRFAQMSNSHFLTREKLTDVISVWQPLLGRLMLNTGRISASSALAMAGAIRKYRPEFLKGFPSSIYFTALCLKDAGITDIGFKAVFSTGEILTPQYRALIESVFNCPVMDSYGHMERTVGISQCPQGGYHVNSDYGLLELIDPRAGSDNPTRVSRAVGTSLYNLSMPLVRYEVGDRIEHFSTPRSCPCGRALPLLKSIHGRSEDIIVTPDGRYITSIFIVPRLVDGIRFAQFVQDTPVSLQVNVVTADGWDDRQKEKLADFTTRIVGTELKVLINRISTAEIVSDPSGKIRPVISCIKKT